MRDTHRPDILDCLANLSNDEVFTPPQLANKMLDILPQELFENPNTRFLDPVCKSGVFLREITWRLLSGLEKVIPDYQERLNHILTKQVFGIAVSKLTALLSRRTLYCNRIANGEKSACTIFDNENGNIFFDGTKHQFLYLTPEQIKEHKEMKFDVIIGNPPYQMSDGGHGDSAKPIYNLFVEQAKKLQPKYLTMIIPARWYSGGKGLDDFRNAMLNDKRLQVIHDYPETKDCFDGINVRGGICYFLWNRDEQGDCTVYNYKDGQIISKAKRPLLENGAETFIRYNNAIDILRKVQAHNEETMEQKVSSRKPFGLATNFSDFANAESEKTPIKLYKVGGVGYVNLSQVEKGFDLVEKIKVLVAKASPGTDDYPHLVFSEPIVAMSKSVCTETYLVVDVVDTHEQGENLKKYMSTKFFRFLVLLVKTTQDVPKRVYQFVPIQDLNETWNDEKLYKKYNITKVEQNFIDTLVKNVNWKLGGDNE